MLKPAKIVQTAQSLENRINARFPGSGLFRVSGDLLSLARQTSKRIDRVERPHWGLRLLLIAIVCCFAHATNAITSAITSNQRTG